MTRSILLTGTATLVAAGFATAALAADVAPGDTLADDQTFSYSLLDQFPTLDPQLNEETAGSHVIEQIFETLTRQDADGNVIPAVATEWQTDDNLTWTFKLRPSNWSNGEPVTAGDFVYAWRRAADPATASPYSWYVELASIENAADIVAGTAAPDTLGVEAVDDLTLKVTLTEPTPYLPSMLSTATFAPVRQATVEEYGNDWTAPANIVSNGAYTLEDIAVNEFFRLEKNPEYYDADDVIIEEITGYVINDRNQSLARWEAGEFDMMDDLPAGSFPGLEEQYPAATHAPPWLCSYYYTFNLTDSGAEAIQDVRVRKAMSYMLNRDVIVDQVLKGGQTPAYNFSHAATAGFEMPDIDYASLSQQERMEQAMALMEEAGYGPGNPIELDLIYNTSDNHKAIATVAAQMWKPLGVNVTLSNYEWQSYLEIRGEQNFDIARNAWCGDYNEASTFLSLMDTDNGSNDGKYSNAEVDRLLAESKTMENPNDAYRQIEQIIADEMPVVPVYHYTQPLVLDPSIRNFPLNNVENKWYVRDMYRAAEK